MKTNKNHLKYFQQAQLLEEEFGALLLAHEMYLRANKGSLALISVSKETPELGISFKGSMPFTAAQLEASIQAVQKKEKPGRKTPEKVLQAWMIRTAQRQNHCLPFPKDIRFITSELAMDIDGKRIVSDILGFDLVQQCWVVLELKSDRAYKRLKEQVNNFVSIIENEENKEFFEGLLALHGYKAVNPPMKAIIWPNGATSPYPKWKADGIVEYVYEVAEDDKFVVSLVG